MFALETVTPTPGKMEARKEVRMHLPTKNGSGLQLTRPACRRQTSFVRLLCSARRKLNNACPCRFLPVETFEAFKAAVEAPGKKIPGLARAAQATKGMLKDAG